MATSITKITTRSPAAVNSVQLSVALSGNTVTVSKGKFTIAGKEYVLADSETHTLADGVTSQGYLGLLPDGNVHLGVIERDGTSSNFGDAFKVLFCIFIFMPSDSGAELRTFEIAEPEKKS